MSRRQPDRSEYEALQKALERHDGLLAKGIEPEAARDRIAADLEGTAAASLFSLATALSDAAAPMPEPAFADAFAARLRADAAQLRTEGAVQRLARRERRRFGIRLPFLQVPGFAYAASAAAIAIFAGLLIPAFRSLPGDSLYGLKRASETARIAIVSGPREARLRLHLAADRFEEVEKLIDRSEVKGAGPGLAALSAADIKDPHLAALIQSTLAEAREQIEVAAKILIAAPAQPATTEALGDLVVVTQRGRKLAEQVAEDLPVARQERVLNTVVTFAKIEAQAKAAKAEKEQMQTAPATLQPCDTPTPSPETSATPSSPAPAASASPEPSVSPTTTPESTPCVSPSPTPVPSPTATPAATPSQTTEASDTPTPAAQQSNASSPDDGKRAESSRRGPPSRSPSSGGERGKGMGESSES
jgi:hypothetical protein